MAELSYKVSAAWSGTGKTGEGALAVGDQAIAYSVPANMGGKGVGASPETLLISAVTACYSGTLFSLLQKKHLPASAVDITTEGFVSGYPDKPRYHRIVVSPMIIDGDENRRDEYIEVARLARDRCFIGQTVAAGGLSYEVGNVTVKALRAGSPSKAAAKP